MMAMGVGAGGRGGGWGGVVENERTAVPSGILSVVFGGRPALLGGEM